MNDRDGWRDKSVRIENGTIEIDACDLAPLLGLPASDLPQLLRAGEVTSVAERGEGEHAGNIRLTFFYKRIRARLVLGEGGLVKSRSSINFGSLVEAREQRRARS